MVQIDFGLIPLLKGLRIGQIFSELVESHDLTLNPEDHGSLRNTYKTSRTIVTDEYEVGEDHPMDIIDDVAEGYKVIRYLDLPKSLAKCMQDTDTRGIKIRHKLKFRIQLHNPDGHVSEVCFYIYMYCYWDIYTDTLFSYALLFPFQYSSPLPLPLTKITT